MKSVLAIIVSSHEFPLTLFKLYVVVITKNSASSRLLSKLMFSDSIKNRASSRLLAQNRVSQVFWEPIKNRVSPRSVLLKAVYLEALLYPEQKVSSTTID